MGDMGSHSGEMFVERTYQFGICLQCKKDTTILQFTNNPKLKLKICDDCQFESGGMNMETLEELKEYIEILKECLSIFLSKKMVLVSKADLKAFITGEFGSKENQKEICTRLNKAIK